MLAIFAIPRNATGYPCGEHDNRLSGPALIQELFWTIVLGLLLLLSTIPRFRKILELALDD